MKKLVLAVCLVMCLAGCADNSAKDSKSSAAESSVSSAEESRFNSHITYTCDKAADNAELDNIGDVLESRYSQTFDNSDHTIIKDYEKKKIKLEFDYAEGAEEFAEISALENKVEFIKGDDKSGEVILTNENIDKCEQRLSADIYGTERWEVALQFDDESKQIFADVTEELAANGMSLSIWLNDKRISAPVVNECVTDGNCVISGDLDEESSAALAKQIAMKPLPFDITLEEYELDR